MNNLPYVAFNIANISSRYYDEEDVLDFYRTFGSPGMTSCATILHIIFSTFGIMDKLKQDYLYGEVDCPNTYKRFECKVRDIKQEIMCLLGLKE